MNAAKGGTYAELLDKARRQGNYSSTGPGGLEFKELVRKFGKHTGREVTVQAALTDNAIHVLIKKASSASSYDADASHAHDQPSYPPTSGKIVPPKTIWQPFIRNEDRPAALAALDNLDNALRSNKGAEMDRNSAKIVHAIGLYSIGDCQAALAQLNGVDRHTPNHGDWEGYDLVLRVAANAIEAQANERLGHYEKAVETYAEASKVYDEVCDVLARSGGLKDDLELRLWGENVMYRGCLWSRAYPDPTAGVPLHRLYSKYSRQWPASFRPTRSLIIFTSYRYLLHESGPSASVTARDWHSEVSQNNSAHEALLRKSTSLPAAGEINKPYLEFLDAVAEGWKRGGGGKEGAAEVVQIMYNALTHTFQSPRLLRHLIRALVAKGSYAEAGKALHLYVDLFDKARETDAAQVARDVRKFRKQAQAEARGEKVILEKLEVEGYEAHEEGLLDDIDADGQYIDTLVFGTRVFCKYLDDPKTGLKLARRARQILDEGKDQSLVGDSVLESKIERAIGVALGALTSKDADLETRPAQQAESLQHLQTATELDPSCWETLYHLAYQLAELRQISPAIEYATQAAGLNTSSNKEVWHLLGLLVTAQKDLGQSLQVLETAIDDDASAVNSSIAPSPSVGLGLQNGSNGSASPQLENPNKRRSRGASVDMKQIDSKLNNLPSAVHHDNFEFPRDSMETLEAEVQIRMTKNVVIEAMEGPEAALLDQQGMLAFFAQTYADIGAQAGAETPRPPALLSAPTTETSVKRSSSMLGRRRSQKSTSGATANGPTSVQVSPPVFPSARSPPNNNASYSTLTLGDGASSSVPTKASNPRATKLLVDLWLMSAASYRRAGKLADAKGAIAEAEALDADDPNVWCQFALYCLATSDVPGAHVALTKALAFSFDHVPSTVLLSRLYLASPSETAASKIPFAEGMLDTLTKGHGWDVPEAWFELSKCYKQTGRKDREKECLVWALQLEETRSIRNLSAVPRLL